LAEREVLKYLPSFLYWLGITISKCLDRIIFDFALTLRADLSLQSLLDLKFS